MMKALLGLVAFGCSHGTVQAADLCNLENENGWCWPTGSSELGGYLKWHRINKVKPDWGLHLGLDVDAGAGHTVYAISAGVVMAVNTDIGSYGGATKKGAAVVLRHELSDGSFRDVIYGHLHTMNDLPGIGDSVVRGELIGRVSEYYIGGENLPHIHFAVRQPIDQSYYDNSSANRDVIYRGYDSKTGENFGFEDPLKFLNSAIALESKWSTVCESAPCEIDSQEFSDGSKVGWHPKGDCSQATKWFGLGLDGDKYVPVSSLQQGDTCICR